MPSNAAVPGAQNALDVDHDGTLTLGDIMAAYDAGSHPEVAAGRKTPDEVFKTFLDAFEGPVRAFRSGHEPNREAGKI